MLQALRLPAPLPAPSYCKAPPRSPDPRALCRPEPQSDEAPGRQPHPDRQRLLAERAVLQLAWIGLLALREGYSACPSECAPAGASPPEPWAEVVEAQLVPEAEEHAIGAYRQAARLSHPRPERLIDTTV